MARLFVDSDPCLMQSLRRQCHGSQSPAPLAETLPLIRFAKPEDIKALVGLLGALFAIEEDFSFDPELQRQGLEIMLEDAENRCVFVAETAGEVVGMVSGQMVVSTAEGGPSVLVEDMVVAASHRGLGLGGKLMAALERWAMMRGAGRLQLVADKNNAKAFEFYFRLGWRPTSLVVLRKKGLSGAP